MNPARLLSLTLAAVGLLTIASCAVLFGSESIAPQAEHDVKDKGTLMIFRAATTPQVSAVTPAMMRGALTVVRHRLQALGIEQQAVVLNGEDRIMVVLPTPADEAEAVRVIATQAALSFRAHRSDWLGEERTTSADEAALGQEAWLPTGLDGSMVEDAYLSHDGPSPSVIVIFGPEGAKRLSAVSRKLMNKQVGIFLDESLLSDPVVSAPIDEGAVQISGQFSERDARELATFIKAGALPVPLEWVETLR